VKKYVKERFDKKEVKKDVKKEKAWSERKSDDERNAQKKNC
jgi:hypothetical protein